MSMKKCLVIPILSMALLTGCGNKTFDKAMKEGKLAMASKEYEKAEGMFSLAIEEKKEDKEANALYDQIQKLIESMKLKEEGKIEEVVVICDDIEKIESESDIVKKEAKILKEECNKELEMNEEEQKMVEQSLIEAEELINNGKYSDAKSKVSELIAIVENKSTLSSQIEKANTLIKTCDKKIDEEKKKQEAINKSNKEESSKEQNSSNESEYDPAEDPSTVAYEYRYGCHNCGQLGHAMRECPNWEDWEEE